MGICIDLAHSETSSQISASDVESPLTVSSEGDTFTTVTTSFQLGDLTWAELSERVQPPVILVPVGATEQHGPHLPLSTDTLIAQALALKLCEDINADLPTTQSESPCLIGPCLTVTSSGEHAGFPGTLSLGAAVTQQALIELTRSADWARGLLLINGHGGNSRSVSGALQTLATEQRNLRSWWPRITGADLHAGHTETSLMLHLYPELVRITKAQSGTHLGDHAMVLLREHGVAPLSPNGVLGDPLGSRASDGEQIFEALRTDLLCSYREWFPERGK
jgi:mycofactocin system creatininase family protein